MVDVTENPPTNATAKSIANASNNGSDIDINSEDNHVNSSQSRSVDPVRGDSENHIVKTETVSSPLGDFRTHSTFNAHLDVNFPMPNSSEMKNTPWNCVDFPEISQKINTSPSSNSEKSLPSFQDTTVYAAYSNMQAAVTYGSTSSTGYSSPHCTGFYTNPVHSGYSTNIPIGTSYEPLRNSTNVKHSTSTPYHYPTAFTSPSSSTCSQTSAPQATSVYSSYAPFSATTPTQNFPQPGPLDYSAYGYGGYYYASPGQNYATTGYATALSQLTQSSGTSTTAYSSLGSPIANDLPYTLSNEANLPPTMPHNKRSRSAKRNRKNNNLSHSLCLSPEPEQPMDRVFIWDLDEAVVLFRACMNGQFIFTNSKDPDVAKQCGTKMHRLMMLIAHEHLFLRDLNDSEQTNIDDVSTEEQLSLQQNQEPTNMLPLTGGLCINGARPNAEWLRKTATRFQRIKDVYKEYAGNVTALLNRHDGAPEEWLRLRHKLEELTEKWLSYAQMCIQLISQRSNCINVVLSSEKLVMTLSELLLFGLGEYFQIENVYSCSRYGKQNCLEKIRSKFGAKCSFVFVGSKEDVGASKSNNIPLWPVSVRSDLETLYYTLEVGHL